MFRHIEFDRNQNLVKINTDEDCLVMPENTTNNFECQ